MDTASSSAVSGIPVMKFTPRNASTELCWRVARRSALRASRYDAPHERHPAEHPAEGVGGAHEVGERVHLVGEGAGERASHRHGHHEREPVEAVDDHRLGEVQPLAAAGQPEHRLEQREDESDAGHEPGAVVAALPLGRGRRRDRRQHDPRRQARRDASPRRRRSIGPIASRAKRGPEPSRMSRAAHGRDLEGGLHGSDRKTGPPDRASADGRDLGSDRGLTSPRRRAPPAPGRTRTRWPPPGRGARAS